MLAAFMPMAIGGTLVAGLHRRRSDRLPDVAGLGGRDAPCDGVSRSTRCIKIRVANRRAGGLRPHSTCAVAAAGAAGSISHRLPGVRARIAGLAARTSILGYGRVDVPAVEGHHNQRQLCNPADARRSEDGRADSIRTEAERRQRGLVVRRVRGRCHIGGSARGSFSRLIEYRRGEDLRLAMASADAFSAADLGRSADVRGERGSFSAGRIFSDRRRHKCGSGNLVPPNFSDRAAHDRRGGGYYRTGSAGDLERQDSMELHSAGLGCPVFSRLCHARAVRS